MELQYVCYYLHIVENKQAKSQSSSTSSFRVIGILSRTRNLHDLKKFAYTTESAKFEMVITQKLFELQPYGLTCVVILILIDNISVELKNMSATCLG